MFSINKTKHMSYKEQLNLIENGQLNGIHSLYVGLPSENLKSINFPNNPLVMNQSDYRKSRRKQTKNKHYSKHGVEFEFFDKMPEYINNAIIFIDNGDKVTVITEYPMKDTKGNDSFVIAGVLLNQTMENDTINQIKSVYPLDDIVNKITMSAEKGKLIISNKNKAKNMFATIGIQTSKVSNILNLAKTSLSQKNTSVNNNST